MPDTLQELLSRIGLGLADFIIFLTRLRESPWWQGHLGEVTLRAGKTSVTFPHQLGRAHRGCVIAIASAPVPAFALRATDPVNVTLQVAVAPAEDVVYSVWVF